MNKIKFISRLLGVTRFSPSLRFHNLRGNSLFVVMPVLVLGLSGCGNFSSTIEAKNKTSLSPCANNAVTTGPCEVDTAGKVVSDNFGNDITAWTNAIGSTSVSAPIPNGFYANQDITFTDLNLLSANIVNGVSIFGVTGTATGPYAACTDDALNAGQCSTAASRYVTATSGNDVTSWTNGSATTTVTGTIPNAYYSSKSCQFTDADLIAANIKTGVNIFGVPGSLTEAYAACTDDALNAGQCSTAATGRYVTATNGSNVNGANGSLTASIPTGFYTGRSCTMSDTNLTVGNIRNGVNIFGVTGTFAGAFDESAASHALRDPGSVPVANHMDNQTTSDQITLKAENTTYAGNDLPTTGGYNYRDIPDQTKDDDGYLGTSCKYAPRPTVNCGTADATLDARIADCAAANPTASTWNGATQCNRGQGTWKLVTLDGANKEVWRDERTKLIWSSLVGSANWCRASGNTQMAPVTYSASFNNAAGTPITGNGTIGNISGGSSSLGETVTITFTSATAFTVTGTGGASGCQGGSVVGGLTTTAGSTATYSDAGRCSFTITQGAVNFANNDKFTLTSTAAASYSCAPGSLQPATAISYCAEGAGFDDTAIGENWGAGTYMAAKGRLGRNATPSVAWRLPTIEDYNIANANGIRFVLPDMGIAGTNRPTIDTSTGSTTYEWSSSV